MSVKQTMPDYDVENYEMPVDEALELARAHHMAENFVLAERTYHDILRAVPDQPTVNHLLGAMYYQLGNIEQALHYMKRSTEIEPSEQQYWSNYGSVLNMAKDYDAAIACFDKALALVDDNVETLNRKALTLWQKGDHEGAESVARKVISLDPENLDGLIHLALALVGQSDFEGADAVWGEACELYPQDVRIWSNWGNMLRENGQVLRAEVAVRKALDLEPGSVEALNNLGCVLRHLGRYDEALEAFTSATNAMPKYYQAHYNKALALYELGRFEESCISARYAIDFNGEYVEGYNILSSSLVEIGEFQQAHFAAQRAVQLAPEDAEAYMTLADVLYLSGHFDDGHAALKRALKMDPDNPNSYLKLANIYERLDVADKAIEAIDRAIELAPNAPICLARKASMLHVLNEIDEALVILDKVIEMAPALSMAYVIKAEALLAVNRKDEAEKVVRLAQSLNCDYPPLYFTLSSIKKFKDESDEDFQAMLAMEDRVQMMGLFNAASLHYAIAQAYDSMKNPEKAFEYYALASRERRQTLPYDENATKANYAYVKGCYPPEALAEMEGRGCDSDVPIFIVGMPRSGTTLTERIISSHPDVFGAGELPDVTRASKKVGGVTLETAKVLGETYVEMASARNKGGAALRITDKMPGNYINIGMIASALPNAKIIHCCRDPFDTCLSNFKQNFLTGQHWSYDLEEMGHEYLRYLDIMKYWHEVLPGRILDIHYEDTVQDLETQARKLIDFVGLEWDDACLSPHKQKSAVLTASKMQVTQPVYSSSVKKWKVYEKQLQPLVKIIDPSQAL